MNAELKGHGISNLISGITGGVPNYLCYSSSVTYFKCNGGSKYVRVGGVRTCRGCTCSRGCWGCTVLYLNTLIYLLYLNVTLPSSYITILYYNDTICPRYALS